MRLITPFDPWRNEFCSCPPKYSLSPYTGCEHGCLYCYASSYIVRFGRVRSKKDCISRLKKEIQKIPPGTTLTAANSSDPYPVQEKESGLTRQMLEVLLRHDIGLLLVTKSSLVERDLDVLKKFRRLVVAITITTADCEIAGKLEPNAPSPEQRLHTIARLSPHIPVIYRLDPLIFPLNTPEVPVLIDRIRSAGARQIITSTYKTKPDNFKRMCAVFRRHKELWEDLYMNRGETFGNYRYLPQNLRKKLILNVKKEAERAGLRFSSCREGFSPYNTASCDGSHFLQNDTDDR